MTELRNLFVDERLPWARVLIVNGELDIGSSREFAEAIQARLSDDETNLVIDLSRCTYLDSTILNVLIRCANAAPERIGIVVPSEIRIRRIFKIAGLESALRLSESREAMQVQFSA